MEMREEGNGSRRSSLWGEDPGHLHSRPRKRSATAGAFLPAPLGVAAARDLRLRGPCSLPSAPEPSISHTCATLNSGNKQRPIRPTQVEATDSGFAGTRRQPGPPVFWRSLKGRSGRKSGGLRRARWGATGWGGCRHVRDKWHVLRDWSGVRVWPSLTGPPLEVGIEI